MNLKEIDTSSIDLSYLETGSYLLVFTLEDGQSFTKKITKL